MPDPVKVLIVDDHPIVRQGLSAIIQSQANLRLVGEATNGIEAIARAQELQPDVVLLDLNMPVCGGLEATLRLRQALPHIKILILTISEKEDDLFNAIKSGALGYILKSSSVQELLSAIESVAGGQGIISPPMAVKLLSEFRNITGGVEIKEEPDLSQREKEVLQCIGKGSSNKEIAAALFISESTVKTHIGNILQKLHLKNRSQIAAYAAHRVGYFNQPNRDKLG